MKKKPIQTLKELDERFASQAQYGWSMVGQQYNAEALTFIAHQLEDLKHLLNGKAKKKRPPSEWQRFFAAGMKDGKTPQQIAAEWRALKEKSDHA